MFRRPTVLILGAGASCHFGYPTGQQLVDGILSLMSEASHPLKSKGWKPVKSYPDHKLWFHNRAFYGNGKCLEKDSNTSNLKALLETLERYPQPIPNSKEYAVSASFYQTLKSFDPINIDAFLGLFKGQFEKIGKYWIAKYLLECENTVCFDREHTSFLTKSETSPGKPWPPRNENWYRYLLDALLSGIQGLPTTQDNRPKEEDDFLSQDFYKDSYQNLEDSFSNLFVLTFKYDVSLEYFLFSRLSSIPAIGRDYARHLLTKRANIHHVYGALYDPFEDFNKEGKRWLIQNYEGHYTSRAMGSAEPSLSDMSHNFEKWAEFCWHCASNIHTIGGEKHNNVDLKDEVKKKIWDPHHEAVLKAKSSDSNLNPKFFFLGFGFDPQNTDLMNLARIGTVGMPNTYWTNYNNSNALRQKFLSATQFECYSTEFSQIESKNSSPRTVYEALTEDFSFL